MHGIGAEEAVLHGAVFKETVADGAHHVEMERIPGDEGHTM
jgi:sortase (surface protein transpeptidase)